MSIAHSRHGVGSAPHIYCKEVGQRLRTTTSDPWLQAMHYRRAQFLLGHMKVLQPFITPQAAARIRYVCEGL